MTTKYTNAELAEEYGHAGLEYVLTEIEPKTIEHEELRGLMCALRPQLDRARILLDGLVEKHIG